MIGTRLVLTAVSAACAAALAATASLTSDAAAPPPRSVGTPHSGHAVVGTAATPAGGADSAAGPGRGTSAVVGRAGGLPRIRGYVGTDATFTISKRKVPKGRYRLVVKDEASVHNWHISGRGVDKETTVGGTGRWVWKVRLRRGTYSVVCDPHSDSMKTSLKVTSD